MYFKHKHDHRYQLVRIIEGYSTSKKSKGRAMTTIVFRNLDLGAEILTYVVVTGQHKNGTWPDGFANEKHWQEIIEKFDECKDYIFYFSPKMKNQYGKDTDFKIKHTKDKDGVSKYTLDADAIPEHHKELLSTFVPVEKPVNALPVKQFDSPLFEIDA